MAFNLSPVVATELAQKLVICFDTGAGSAGEEMSDILNLYSTDTGDTAQNTYVTASSDYALRQRDPNLSTITFDGIRVYETRIDYPQFYKFIEVDLLDWSDDKIGKYGAVFHTLGYSMALAPSRLAEDVFSVAHTAQNVSGNFDGVPLISDDHPLIPTDSSSDTWKNLLIRPAGLTPATFQDAWQLYRTNPNEDGRPGSRKPKHLVHKSADRTVAWDICFADKPSTLAGGDNPNKGLVTPIEVPFLDSDADFGFALVGGTGDKFRSPLRFQERDALKLTPLYTNPSDPWVILNNKLIWGVLGRYNAGYGDPRSIVSVRKR